MIGRKFGRLTVIQQGDNIQMSNGKVCRQWYCQCDCGNTKIVREQLLLYGKTKSCGCLYKETRKIVGNRNKRHSHSRDRLYRIWNGMLQRCNNPNDDGYKDYGAKGILVCKEWLSYIPFERWALSAGYQPNLTIDRIDTSGNYTPTNCRWATAKTQANNRSNNRYVTINGETKTLKQWCEIYKMPYSTVYKRITKRDYSPLDALTEPIDQRKSTRHSDKSR